MTTITAIIAPTPQPIVNPHLTADLGDYLTDYWPTHAKVARIAACGTLARVDPAAHPRSLVGLRARGYGDDYYQRVHVRPAHLALGNLSSNQVRSIEVWNAWRAASQTLDAVTIDDAAGISLTAPASLPITFAPLQSLMWTATVTLDGPPTIDSHVQWQFGATQNVTCHIDGQRVTAWTWPPNWDTGITERLSWLTSVATSPTGAEQRRACRLSPRATFEFSALALASDRATLDMALYDAAGRNWALPIWHDVERLPAPLPAGATAIPSALDRDYHPGGFAMILGGGALDYEVVQIAALGASSLVLARPTLASWPTGSRLYPVRIARFDGAQGPQAARQHDALWAVQVRFALAESYDATPLPPATSYRGAPVIEAVPDEARDLGYDVDRILQTIDNQVGIVRQIDTAGFAFPRQAYAITCANRADAVALRGLLYALRGRQVAVWVPTFAQDLTLAATLAHDSVFLAVARCGYTRFVGQRAGRRDLRIDVVGHSPIYRRIVASAEVDAATELLTLDAALGIDVSPAQVRRISFMALCRMDSDDVEIDHVTDADGITQCTLTFRALRDDLELA